MIHPRVLWKVPVFTIALLAWFACAIPVQLLTLGEVRKKKTLMRLNRWFNQLGLKIIGVELVLKNAPAPDRHAMIVANHMGFLDIFVLASVAESMFVTSNEMKETPVLGWVTQAAGCFFVERRDREKTQGEMKDLRKTLEDGFSVVLYPEGTSSDGSLVLPFKRTLISAAAGTGVPIQPVVINWLEVNGEAVSDRWRDSLCWYGEMSFAPAFLRLLSMRSVKAEVIYCQEIFAKSEEQRREIADTTRALIVAQHRPIVYPPGVSRRYNFKLPEPRASSAS